MALAPRWVLWLYIGDDAWTAAPMVLFAVQYLAIAAAFQLFDGAQAVLAGALRGLQDTRMPMVLALVGYWIFGFGTSVLFGFFTPLSGLGVWLGLAVGLVVVTGLLLWRWGQRERLGLVYSPRAQPELVEVG